MQPPKPSLHVSQQFVPHPITIFNTCRFNICSNFTSNCFEKTRSKNWNKFRTIHLRWYRDSVSLPNKAKLRKNLSYITNIFIRFFFLSHAYEDDSAQNSTKPQICLQRRFIERCFALNKKIYTARFWRKLNFSFSLDDRRCRCGEKKTKISR